MRFTARCTRWRKLGSADGFGGAGAEARQRLSRSPAAALANPALGHGVMLPAAGRRGLKLHFVEKSGPSLDEDVVCGLQSRQCLLHRSGSDPWDFSPSLVCARCCFKGFLCCASPLLPVFLTQGVSQQILRLDKIPNSRCLIKIKTTTKKKTLPSTAGLSSVELQLLTPGLCRLRAVPLPTSGPRRAGGSGTRQGGCSYPGRRHRSGI